MAMVFAVHGLWRQAQGDDEAFAADLERGLWLARNLRDGGPVIAALVAAAGADGRLLTGLDRWLERLRGRPDLLRRVLAALRSREAGGLGVGRDNLLAERLV